MKTKITALFILCLLTSAFLWNFNDLSALKGEMHSADTLIYPQEKHFKNMQMLTNGGENAEAYFSFDGSKIIFQATGEYECDQIFIMNPDGSGKHLVSTGKGRTTCSYFYPDGKSILYASTHLGGDMCPQKPDHSKGYVWALYSDYDIFKADLDGSNPVKLTDVKGYDAEATVSPKGDKIIFTSTRNGDIDLYSMNLDGSDVKQLTNIPGYDGGAYYSYDGTMIVFRASRFDDPAKLKEYQDLLAEGLIRPGQLEIYVMNADGSNIRQVTNNGAANFGPYFFPDGKRIIYCSNQDDPKGRNFDLYMINVDGTGNERITYNDTFDGFPMFSLHDGGKKFVFCSNRFNAKQGETNVFICDWVE
ncbi:MAG: PD40 domain-containing protein [Ignavibacteria bacterium]|nr:PD40 domain-containing protein [Ignavibacteria bacterium]